MTKPSTKWPYMRSELTTCLQPRPRVAKPNPGPDKGSFKGPPFKGGGKHQKGTGKSKSNAKGKGKGKTTWVSDIYLNGEWKSLCLRYQSGKCNFPDCRFVHACAHPKPDGTACGGKHTAMEHASTPHWQESNKVSPPTSNLQLLQDGNIPMEVSPSVTNNDFVVPEAAPPRDKLQDQSSATGAFCPNEQQSMTTIPRSVSNPLAISLETTISKVGSRIFLDLCAGYQRPLSSSLMHFRCDVCTFDILVHPQDDILDDIRYELLLRLACSRQVAYAAGSPSCNEYSRRKLRPGGPRALRTPDQLNGIPGLTADEQLRLQASATMLCRVVTCLTLTYLSGGHCHLDQPINAMSWLEPEVQSYIANVGIHCVVIAACEYQMDVDKSWIFSTSLASLKPLGALCSHQQGTHQSIIGTKHPDGSFKSRDTAQYPPCLCDAFASKIQHLFSKNSLDATCDQMMQFLAIKARNSPPFSCEDGGGFPHQIGAYPTVVIVMSFANCVQNVSSPFWIGNFTCGFFTMLSLNDPLHLLVMRT